MCHSLSKWHALIIAISYDGIMLEDKCKMYVTLPRT